MDLDITVDHRVAGRTETTGVRPDSAASHDAYSAFCLPYHEAALCVVALHLGLPVRYVTIRREEAVEATGDPDAAGHTALAPYAGEAGVLATVAFAGIVSDATFGFPGAVIEGNPSAAIAAAACRAAHDFEQFRRFLPDPRAQREASLRVHEILRRNRDRVTAVGLALADRGRFTGDDVLAALVEAGHPWRR
jgi:hypothetical protein